jgi:hypothetical protein
MQPVKPMQKLAIPDHAQRGHLMTQFLGWPLALTVAAVLAGG